MPAKGTFLLKRGNVTYRVTPATKDIAKVETAPRRKSRDYARGGTGSA